MIATIGVTSYITYKFQKKGEEEDEDTVEITVDDDVDDAEKKLKNKNLANEDKKDTNENMVLILDETKDNNNEKSNYQKNITQSNKLELETKKAEGKNVKHTKKKTMKTFFVFVKKITSNLFHFLFVCVFYFQIIQN